MNDQLIDAIQTFTLQARADLERETHEQLEGLYGWLPDGSFAPENRYPALTLPEAHETRARLEQYARDEAEAGFDAVKARRKLVRETAFTWLNRFVAFKMLETRRVVKTVLAPPERANAYLLWLADEHDPEARRLYDAHDTRANVFGESPRQTAYRRFLLWQCSELAHEMSVLFDPSTLASRLCSRPNALRALIEALNAADLADAWTAGNEETIGWVYEGFIEDDNKAVFAKFSKGKKVFPDEIGAATQRFTPRWIVKFLVENSLGRLWLEMHPDSKLKERLTYFIPAVGKSTVRPLKPVREILFLDPSCGSMHFGLVAFDVLAEMYREEMAHAGQPGWPAEASVATESDIPSAIVAHNLHGIDIDPRAVQIAALTLLIKARGLNREATVTDRNLACCNIEAITGGRLDAIIRGAQLDQPIQDRLLHAMAARLKNSDNLGSLLRPETDLERLIEEERKTLEAKQEEEPLFVPPDLRTPEAREKFFAGLAQEISVRLDVFVQSSRTAGKDESHFVSEAAKGLTFLRLVQQRYDVVATNPPYMGRRNMSDIMARYLDDDYSAAKGDLYAAFIARCVELTDPLGFAAMVTQQSFMFISSYERLRESLRESIVIKTMAHLGPKAFPNVAGEKVNTAAFIFERQPDPTCREAGMGVYFRLVRERAAEGKRLAFESAIAALRAGQTHPQVFSYKQSDFDTIPGKPWVYWIPYRLGDMFAVFPKTSSQAPVKEGINTGDNFRFMRYWWEVSRHEVGPSRRWCRFAKGNRPIPYINSSAYIVRNNVAEMRTLPGSRIFNEEYFFRPAVGFLSNSSTGFCAWLTEAGHMFCSTGGRSVFPAEDDMHFFVALLNTTIFKSLIDLINPTISYKAGDVAVVPVPAHRSQALAESATQCVGLSRQDSYEDEMAYSFILPLRKVEDRASRHGRLTVLEMEIDAEISRLYGLSEDDLAAIDRELADTPAISSDEDAEEPSGNNDESEDVEVLELSQAELSRRWISYAIGTVLGRFEIGTPDGFGRGDFSDTVAEQIRKLIDDDGIMPSEAGHAQDLAARTLACLDLMLGVQVSREAIKTALGEGDPLDALRDWLDRFAGQPAQSFWRYHFQMYRKRPAYWPFQSPERKYTVWVFHEKIGPDTLFRIRKEYAEPRLRLAEREITDLLPKSAKDRKAAKELDRMRDLADDLRAFIERLQAITNRGYTPYIDDGVLLNAAPLHKVLPYWPDTQKTWQELSQGKYDWAHQAMAYWPDRVKAACLTNRSFAIAHGLAVPQSEKSQSSMPKRRERKRKV